MKPSPSLICSQPLNLIGTSENIYNQTAKHRDIFSSTSSFGKAGNISKPMGETLPQHLVTPVRSDGLSAMTVLKVLQLYRERQRIMCPLGVLYTKLQVSLMQMSRWRAQIHSPMEENSCRVLTMRIHQYLYGERRHYPCPLGVLYTNLQVSLMQMSRWRAQIHLHMEENSCRVLTRRIHQTRPRVDKDNPTGQVQKARN